MRPSTLRPSALSTEGLALIDLEAAAFRAKYAGRTKVPAPATGKVRPYGPMVRARMANGALIQHMLVVEAIEGCREDLHNAIVRALAAKGWRLHTVIEYGDEAARWA